MSREPPVLPPASVYTHCWCEENIYLLCQNFLENPTVKEFWEVYVVFISNEIKSVALWCQKAARVDGDPVVWDYHVLLALRPRNRYDDLEMPDPTNLLSWVYDFDTCLPIPCGWEEYLGMTFPEGIPPLYESRFRVVPGEQFLQHFASDRSHMLIKVVDASDRSSSEDVRYSSPPPIYKPICGPSAKQNGIQNNLMSNYVSIAETSRQNVYGDVLTIAEANMFFSV